MPYVVTLLNWVSIFEWYMAQLVINRGRKDIEKTMSLDCLLILDEPVSV